MSYISPKTFHKVFVFIVIFHLWNLLGSSCILAFSKFIYGNLSQFNIAFQVTMTWESYCNSNRRDWLLNLFAYHAKYNTNNQRYQVWIQDNHPIELVTPKWIRQKLNYIHLNPVRARIVEQAPHYLYSSAANYIGKQGVLEVTLIDLGITDFYVFTGSW